MSDQRSVSAIPVAFISSTSEDLANYRQSARDAALTAKFHPEMMEYFTASGARPPLETCLKKVAEADVVVVLVAYRYGWIPPNQPGKEYKSITWLECEQAVKEGKEVLAFLIADGFSWPEEQREESRMAAALRRQGDGRAAPGGATFHRRPGGIQGVVERPRLPGPVHDAGRPARQGQRCPARLATPP